MDKTEIGDSQENIVTVTKVPLWVKALFFTPLIITPLLRGMPRDLKEGIVDIIYLLGLEVIIVFSIVYFVIHKLSQIR